MDKPKIAITIGDPAGIGSEIVVKALNNKEIYNCSKPLVIGSKCLIEDALRFTASNLTIKVVETVDEIKGKHGVIDLLDLDNISLEDFNYGKVSGKAGQASLEYIDKGIDLAMDKFVDAVVTGPINKESIQSAGSPFAGHTEIFANRTKTKNYAMFFLLDNLRVIHVSTHVSLRQACDLVKKARVLDVIRLSKKVLKDLGIENPRIGVAGLNPHSGEGGLFGQEEIDEIIPAINQAKKEGILADGPVPPDTIFPKVIGGQYDIAVVMYHDQGHIPVKTMGFKYNEKTDLWSTIGGINITAGLPIIRTSVDHGVAYDRAGEGRANEGNMIEAIYAALKFIK